MKQIWNLPTTLRVQKPEISFALISFLLICIAALMGCTPVEFGVERTATPGDALLGTVEALEAERNYLQTQVADRSLPEENLSERSESDDIRQRLLSGYRLWQTIQLTARVTSAGMVEGQPQLYTLWLDQSSNGYKVLQTSEGRTTGIVEIANPDWLIRFNLETGEAWREQPELVDYRLEPAAGPDPMRQLRRTLGPPLADLIFPEDLGQRAGQYSVKSVDRVAGRPAVVVEWTFSDSSAVDRLWLDARTGIVLRWQNFSTPDFGELPSEIIVEHLEYEPELADGEFNPSLQNIDELLASELIPSNNTPLLSIENQGEWAVSDLFFFLRDPVESTDQTQLVRVAGSCFVIGEECPPIEIVEGAPVVDRTIWPLSWSQDGKLAALIGSVPGTDSSGLYIYEPAEPGWTLIGEFDSVESPAFWSPQADWLALKASREGRLGLYLVPLDGTDLLEVSQVEDENGTVTAYPLGWLDERLLYQIGAGEALELRTFQPSTETQASLGFEIEASGKAYFNMSPAGDQLAWVDRGEFGGYELKLLGLERGDAIEVANFASQSLWPIAWNSDVSELAFGNVFSTASAGQGTQGQGTAVFLIDKDGTDLRQVFTGELVSHLAYSPSQPMLAIEGSEGFGAHIYVVNTETGERRLLSVPGLSLSSQWLGPSWQPAAD